MSYTAWSQHYIYEDTDSATCNVNIDEWRRIHDEAVGAERIFAKIVVGDKTTYIALGAPVAEIVPHSEHIALFLPSWILDILEAEGSGETVQVEWLDSDPFSTLISRRSWSGPSHPWVFSSSALVFLWH